MSVQTIPRAVAEAPTWGRWRSLITQESVATLARIAAELCRAYPTLSPDAVVGHSDVAPGRKSDPGIAFDWPLLRSRLSYYLEVRPA